MRIVSCPIPKELDADRTGQIAVEAFTCLLIFKNIFSFILTFFAYDWLVNNGVKPAFMAIASIQMVICLLSIPMCKDSTSEAWRR